MNVTDFNAGKIGSIGKKMLLVALIGSLLLPAALGGGAIAQTDTSTATPPTAGDDAQLNETITTTNESTGVWIEVVNATSTVDATIVMLDNGSIADWQTVTLDATGNTSALKEVSVDATTVDKVRVQIDTNATVETADAGLVSRVGVGGGGLGNGSGLLGGDVSMRVLAGAGLAVLVLGLSAVALMEG